ncbi:unnamed protein product [Acanthoscelides obtectus]|uniref:Uncharacterized protein n=1 Tax=Acanthoscelides obtectus TaxID=200917 RepID=A0A9P0VTB4_ACAOB|nr:unnamed protein product [Acanthoscelides obtectus]CAK1689448.1 hypothetical protein AOBTE_LOCUS37266 [Acanthoscelides obtectus]
MPVKVLLLLAELRNLTVIVRELWLSEKFVVIRKVPNFDQKFLSNGCP